MNNPTLEHVFGIPINSAGYLLESSQKRLLYESASQYHEPQSSSYAAPKFRKSKVDSVIVRMTKIGEKVDNLAQGIREHVRLGPKLTETVKGKLKLGTRILQVGGMEKVFKQKFSVREGEKLLKASKCYISTTAGPIAGFLFISTDKIAFCSERSIKISSPSGELIKIYYKVIIPLKKIDTVAESENVKKPSTKYMKIVTKDNFEFWFMGFLNHRQTFEYTQQALSQLSSSMSQKQ